MKTVFVLCICVAAVSAGVIQWTQQAEQEASDLYTRYCLGRETTGEDGNLIWHCKKSPEGGRRLVIPHNHQLQLNGGRSTEQLVFIETPADDYRHEVLVTGRVDSNHKTKVVVIPAIDKVGLDIKDDVSVNVQSAKPQILFLKNNPNERAQSGPSYASGPANPSYFSG